MSLLSLQNLTLQFGGITAVNDVSLTVNRGQIYSIIGPNGAGKTTVFNAITGIYSASSGQIAFADHPLRRHATPRTYLGGIAIGLVVALLAVLFSVGLEGLWEAAVKKPFASPSARFDTGVMLRAASDYLSSLITTPTTITAAILGFLVGITGATLAWLRNRQSPDVISRGGIARTFQNIRLFSAMTVKENVLVGMDRQLTAHPLLMALGLRWHREQEQSASQRTTELLDFVGLGGQQAELARNLPYGSQRRLEIARALATEPKLLLLDEPAAGMNPTETADLMHLIRKIRDRGITVLLIEHHMNLVMGISDRVAVLDYGVKIAEGSPAEVVRDPRVIEAYLGNAEVH